MTTKIGNSKNKFERLKGFKLEKILFSKIMINQGYMYLRKCDNMARKPYFLQETVVFNQTYIIIITKSLLIRP